MLNIVVPSGELILSPIDLYIDDQTVLQPDLVYVGEENSGILSQKGITGAPNLVIEVLSPSNSFVDRNTKKNSIWKLGLKSIG